MVQNKIETDNVFKTVEAFKVYMQQEYIEFFKSRQKFRQEWDIHVKDTMAQVLATRTHVGLLEDRFQKSQQVLHMMVVILINLNRLTPPIPIEEKILYRGIPYYAKDLILKADSAMSEDYQNEQAATNE